MNYKGLLIFGLLLLGCSQSKTQELATNSVSNQVLTSVNQVEGNVDLVKSVLYWRGTKLMGARFHEGIIKLSQGQLDMENGALTGGEFWVDIASIRVTDIPDDQWEAKSNLEKHLKSDFAVERFPFSIFKIETVSEENGLQKLCGMMEIRGVNKPLCLLSKNEGQFYSATVQLSKSDWGIGDEGSWLAKRLTDDEFTMRIELWVK